MPDLVVAGAGMAGLVAATEAKAHGAGVVVLEKGDRPGGSFLLSSGVAWRHRAWDDLRAECPRGDPDLQRLVHERLDEDLDWLERRGARVVEHSTRNRRTTGVRLDPAATVAALARGVDVRLGTPLRALPDRAPVVLATGGFPASRDLVREHITAEADALLLRATRWSTGDGLRLGLEAGGRPSEGLGELYGRAMPAPPARIGEREFVELSQLYARHATVEGADGTVFETRTWSEIDVVQWMACQPGARATFRVARAELGARVQGRAVGEMIDAAERAGAPVRRRRESVEVDVVAGITSTLGGLAVDTAARVTHGVWAAGGDVGGLSTGGYASGLAAALVLGRLAARSALGVG